MGFPWKWYSLGGEDDQACSVGGGIQPLDPPIRAERYVPKWMKGLLLMHAAGLSSACLRVPQLRIVILFL